MDYKKLYEKALERAKTIYQGGSYKPDIGATIAEILQNVFPEIKESEDERIRKAILNYFTKCWGNCKDDVCGIHVEDVIAWLEKQGKQKPIMDIPSREVILSIWDLGNEWKELTGCSISSEYGTQLDYIQKHWNESEYYLRENQGKQETICDKCRKEQPSHSCQDITALGRCAVEYERNLANKVKQKFNEGDWIVNNNNGSVYQVTEIRNDEYCIWPLNGEIMGYLRIIDVDKDYHLWTIKDAKDGDILMANAPFIFNGNLEGGIGCPGAHCAINTLGKFQIPKYQTHWTGHTTTPATKDQCDTLFAKMREAGYEWDAEKKEPKKTKQIFHEGDWIISSVLGTARIIGIKNDSNEYLLEYIYGKQKYSSIDYVNYAFDKWTIKDARPGDVLVAPKIYGSEHSEQIFIFKEIKDRDYAKNAVEYYCRVVDGEFYTNEQGFMGQSNDNFVPATKEQRELLFQKMHESGYELLKSI